jgi:hypothetical protein
LYQKNVQTLKNEEQGCKTEANVNGREREMERVKKSEYG